VRIGFAGAGSIAAAMARGWSRSDAGPELLFCDIVPERAASLAKNVDGETRDSLTELRDDADVVLLAVKPAALEDLAAELEGRAPALLSVMAATTVGRLAEAFPGVPTLRVMPNQAAEVGRGVLCYVPPAEMDEDLSNELISLLGALGTVVAVPEERIDAAMAVMSCAPAYVALFAEALAAGGEQNGLDRAMSLELVAGTLEGTAELLRERDPEAIRKAVAPPGGTTEAGLEALAEHGFEDAIAAAVQASLERFK
jgi:pyrroline-5-carboxylate reductase